MDVIKRYKKDKMMKNIFIICISLLLGFSINSFVLTSNYWQSLKTNLLETTWQVEQKADFFLENIKDSANPMVKLRAWKNLDLVNSASFWIVFNPENVEIKDVFSKIYWVNIKKLENEKGIATIILTFVPWTNISLWEDILTFYIVKKEQKTENINILNANFKDSLGKIYELTTSWVAF